MKSKIIKKYYKYLLINIVIISYFFYKDYKENKFLNKEILILENKKNDLEKDYKELLEYFDPGKNEEVGNFDIKNKIINDEFIKIIYELCNEANLKLIDMSSEIEKINDNSLILVYRSFKIKGDLKGFYEFMYYLYFSNQYIDNTYSSIHIYDDYLEISLGYLKGG